MAPAHAQTAALRCSRSSTAPWERSWLVEASPLPILHKDPVFYRASGTQPFQKAGSLHLRIVDSDLHHTQLSRLGEKPADHGPGNAQLRGNIALLLIV